MSSRFPHELLCANDNMNCYRPPLQCRQNPVELLRVDVQCAIRPNN